ncbi:hypothetical protein TUM20985_24520 [Mycobacterium antarcticum]|uniref:DUF2249 domain-containing protein n=1 Tax=unclassified Mycolicibacterium TaxID=2636767 RepID=UPI0023A5D504|nr:MULTISPECIES: DUF2249 domain-containing protein [unclassified Mycolicibacterium]BDX31905.1 hypothetical protein TUM20985_24520 [Mycolicibacterium sp. TUM20985]GLP80979.1 hypothetical protein TUM20984_23990 [Mycolicibacterium sp. TUM20984]
MSLPDPEMSFDGADELDVRRFPKSQRDQMIFARFDALEVGQSFVLVICHDPLDLRQQFARARPGAHKWRYLEGSQSERLWRIRIVKIMDLPRSL